MISKDITLGLLFLIQTGFGALGNAFLLGFYTIKMIGSRMRPLDLFLCHLSLVNELVLLSKGIPHTMAILGFTNFLDDVGCKLVFYFHKVARDLSLCTTCLLSGFQAITLSPRSSWWAKVQARARKCIIPLFLFCWAFHLLKNVMIPIFMKGLVGNKNITEVQDYIYCAASFPFLFNIATGILIISFPDFSCIGLMVGTSGYMIFVLYKHHQRVRYIHGYSLKPSGSPETRATQTILLLVLLFVSFYSLNSILTLYIRNGKSSWVVHISTFLAACFPAFSSFVLIVSDSHVNKYFLTLWGKMMMQF